LLLSCCPKMQDRDYAANWAFGQRLFRNYLINYWKKFINACPGICHRLGHPSCPPNRASFLPCHLWRTSSSSFVFLQIVWADDSLPALAHRYRQRCVFYVLL